MTTHLSDVEEINRVLDALAESVLETSDEDIHQETIDEGENPQQVAHFTRALLLRAVVGGGRQAQTKVDGGERRNKQLTREFWDSLFAPLYHFLCLKIRYASHHLSQADAEECAQEVLLRIHQNWDISRLATVPLDERRKVFYAGVSHTVHSVLVDHTRNARATWSKNGVAIDSGCPPRSGPSVLASALDRLTPVEQMIVSEHLINNRSYLDIEMEFRERGIPVTRAILDRALQKLRSTVERESSVESHDDAGDNRIGRTKGFFLGQDGAGRPIRCYEGGPHLVTMGAPGSGKTTGLLIPALLTFEGSCVVIDPKGEIAAVTRAQRERLGQRVFVLNPFGVIHDKLGETARFNPLDWLDPEAPSFRQDCDRLAASLIARDETGDDYWSNAARQMMSGIIMHVIASGEVSKGWDAVRKAVCSPLPELRTILDSTVSSDDWPAEHNKQCWHLAPEENSRAMAEIAATAWRETAFLDSPAIANSMRHSDFSFRDLKKEPTTVYLVLPQMYLHVFGNWLRLLVTTALATVMDEKPEAMPVLMVLDDFPELGHLEEIETAMRIGAQSGVQVWAVVQDLAQLKRSYKGSWRTLLDNAGVLQFFPTSDRAMEEYVSKRWGEATLSVRTLPGTTDGGDEEMQERNSKASVANACRSFVSHANLVTEEGDRFFMFAQGIDHPIEGRSRPYWEIGELAERCNSEGIM